MQRIIKTKEQRRTIINNEGKLSLLIPEFIFQIWYSTYAEKYDEKLTYKLEELTTFHKDFFYLGNQSISCCLLDGEKCFKSGFCMHGSVKNKTFDDPNEFIKYTIGIFYNTRFTQKHGVYMVFHTQIVILMQNIYLKKWVHINLNNTFHMTPGLLKP